MLWKYPLIATLLVITASFAVGGSDIGTSDGVSRQPSYQFSPKNILMQMTEDEKANAVIHLVLEQQAGALALEKAHQIDVSWNTGQFSTALELFDELAPLTQLNSAEIHVTWKVPPATSSPDRYGTDVQISTRDSVSILEMEIHHGTGNLIALVIFEGDGSTTSIETRLSTDGGNTWVSKYVIGMGTEVVDASASVWEDHCYLAYNYSFFNDTRLIRYNCETGVKEQISGSDYLTIHEDQTIKELKLSSADDYVSSNDYLYLALIETDNDLVVYRIDIGAISTWQQLTTTIGNCDRGLDIFVTPSIWFPVYISYIHTGNNVVISRYEGTSSHFVPIFTTQVGGSIPDETCLDIYESNIVCLFEYYSTAESKNGIYGWYSDDLGTDYWFQLIDDWATNRFSPSITMRRGGGIGIAYSTLSMYPVRRGKSKWRPYDSLSFYNAPEVTYADNWTSYQQDIEYLGGGIHGIAYVSSDLEAWFDRGSGCCVIRGDINHDAAGPDIADLVYLVNYMFNGGASPFCISETDVNGSGADPDIADLVYLVNYMFNGGPALAPCP
ncbi:MAG: hypothetical protein ABIE70_03800 [bacterium]